MKKNKFIFILFFIFFSVSQTFAANRCQDSLFREFGFSEDYINRFMQRSKTETQYGLKKNAYTDDNIYRGFVNDGRLSLDVAVKYVLTINENLVGNGVKITERGLRSAFRNYNQRASNREKFLDHYREHLKGEGDLYWESLLSSWSTESTTPINFSGPHIFTGILGYLPNEGYGVLVTAHKPKQSPEAATMQSQFNIYNQWHAEKELSVAVAMDPELIKKITFWQYDSENAKMVRTMSSLVLQIERQAWGVYEIRQGWVDPTWTGQALEYMTIEKRYQLKIKPNNTYTIVPI